MLYSKVIILMSEDVLYSRDDRHVVITGRYMSEDAIKRFGSMYSELGSVNVCIKKGVYIYLNENNRMKFNLKKELDGTPNSPLDTYDHMYLIS